MIACYTGQEVAFCGLLEHAKTRNGLLFVGTKLYVSDGKNGRIKSGKWVEKGEDLQYDFNGYIRFSLGKMHIFEIIPGGLVGLVYYPDG